MRNYIDILNSKMIPETELERNLARFKFQNKKIVFTNGCFDIMHRGHVEYLAKAASLGDVLVLGLNSDASIKRIKGPGRPVQDQESRARVLSAFCFIDYIIIFDEDSPLELIKRIKPDILVKGGDYKIEEIVGYDFVVANGGKVCTVDLVEGHSTTNLINKIAPKK